MRVVGLSFVATTVATPWLALFLILEKRSIHVSNSPRTLLPNEKLLAPRSPLAIERGSPIATARRLAIDGEDSALGIVTDVLRRDIEWSRVRTLDIASRLSPQDQPFKYPIRRTGTHDCSRTPFTIASNPD